MLLQSALFCALTLFAHSVLATPLYVYAVNFRLGDDAEMADWGYEKHRDECNNDGYLSMSKKNKGAEYNFTGTRVEAHFVVAPDGALGEIDLDGVPAKQVTTLNKLADPDDCNLLMYDSGNLTNGAHSIFVYHGGNDPAGPPQNGTLRLSKLVIFMDHKPTVPGEIPGPTTTAGADPAKAPPLGPLIGGIVGGVACFVAMCLLILYLFRQSKKNNQEYHPLGDGKSGRPQSVHSASLSLHPTLTEESGPLMRTTSHHDGQSLYHPISPILATSNTQSAGHVHFAPPPGPPVYSPPVGHPQNISPVSTVYSPPIIPPPAPPLYQPSPTSMYGGWNNNIHPSR